MSPGVAEYWDHFYDSGDDGVLTEKSRRLRKMIGKRLQDELKNSGGGGSVGAAHGDELEQDDPALLRHYEWFMRYDQYGAKLLEACRSAKVFEGLVEPTELRVLHIGCGNSDMCEHFSRDFVEEHSHAASVAAGSSAQSGSAKRLRRKHEAAKQQEPCTDVGEHDLNTPAPTPATTSAPPTVCVVNMDICKSLLLRLSRLFSSRIYCVGDCCDMIPATSQIDADCTPTAGALKEPALAWFTPDGNSSKSGLAVCTNSVDLVFDKGTLDALLSAFPGEENPNAASYMGEVLRVLRPGGLLVIISINALSVVAPYVYGALVADCDDVDKDVEGSSAALSMSFRLHSHTTIDVNRGGEKRPGDDPCVETLGTHYNVFAFLVFVE